MKTFSIFVVFVAALTGQLFAGKVDLAKSQSPEVYIVKVHADWCGSCQALKQPLSDLVSQLQSEPVLFVELDFTNDGTIQQSSLLADALEIREAVGQYNGTGKVLIVDASTGKVTKVLTLKDSVADMKAAVKQALAS
ncbi:MAG: thioredoxin domain-containing protein [Verrucomicrobiota bacterium]